MMHVKNLNAFRTHPIEEPVWIADKRHDSDARSLGDFLRTVRPCPDARRNRFQAVFEPQIDRRVMRRNILKNLVEITQRVVSEDEWAKIMAEA